MKTEILDLMNYNYENPNGKSYLYDTYSKFIELNNEIMTIEQLKKARTQLLSPGCFTDDKERDEKEYNNIQNNIDIKIQNKYEKGKGMQTT